MAENTICESTGGAEGYRAVVFPPSRNARVGRWLWKWDVCTGKRRSILHYAASRTIQILWLRILWGPLVREIVRECCSLPRRIGTIYATKLYRHGVCFGHPGSAPARTPDERTLACIQDTQRITSLYRWANSLDVKLIVEAWQLGAEWASALPGSTLEMDSTSTDADATLVAPERVGTRL